jgi:hypothetical protein
MLFSEVMDESAASDRMGKCSSLAHFHTAEPRAGVSAETEMSCMTVKTGKAAKAVIQAQTEDGERERERERESVIYENIDM